MSNKSSSTSSVKFVRWIARILGTLLPLTFIGFFSADVIEEGAFPKIDLLHLFLTFFFLIALIGYVVAWWKEGLGILMAFTGIILGIIINSTWVHQGNAPKMLFYLFPAVLFLFCWLSDKKKSV